VDGAGRFPGADASKRDRLIAAYKVFASLISKQDIDTVQAACGPGFGTIVVIV